jgi:hypothetical protein
VLSSSASNSFWTSGESGGEMVVNPAGEDPATRAAHDDPRGQSRGRLVGGSNAPARGIAGRREALLIADCAQSLRQASSDGLGQQRHRVAAPVQHLVSNRHLVKNLGNIKRERRRLLEPWLRVFLHCERRVVAAHIREKVFIPRRLDSSIPAYVVRELPQYKGADAVMVVRRIFQALRSLPS